MRTLKLLKRYKEKVPGDIVEVENNIAHAWIENGLASLLTFDEKGNPIETSDTSKLTSNKDESQMKKGDKDKLKKHFEKPPKDKMMAPGKQSIKTK